MNHYMLLGTHAGATTATIKTHYRLCVWKHQPDRLLGYVGAPASAKHFARVTVAFHVLRDKSRRAAYDLQQSLRYAPCIYCSKGSSHDQQGLQRRVATICSRCNGSGFKEKLK